MLGARRRCPEDDGEPALAQASPHARRAHAPRARAAPATRWRWCVRSSPPGDVTSRAARWLEQRILRAAEGQTDALRDSAARRGRRRRDRRRQAARRRAGLRARAPVPPTTTRRSTRWRRVLAIDPGHGAAVVEIAVRAVGRAPRRRAAAALAGAPRRRRHAPRSDCRSPCASAPRCSRTPAIRPPPPAPTPTPPRARPATHRRAKGSIASRTRSEDPAAHLAALERERATPSRPRRASPSIVIVGERLERDGHPDKAAEHYRHALEARPDASAGAPGARARAAGGQEPLRARRPRARRSEGRARSAGQGRRLRAAGLHRRRIARRRQSGAARLGVDPRGRSRPPRRHARAREALSRRAGAGPSWSRSTSRWASAPPIRRSPSPCTSTARACAAASPPTARASACPRPSSPPPSTTTIAWRCSKIAARRPALRHVYARARTGHDLAQEAEPPPRSPTPTPDDARTAAVMLTRAAEALVELDRPEDARARYEAAVERLPSHVPALVGLTDFALARSEWGARVARRRARRPGAARQRRQGAPPPRRRRAGAGSPRRSGGAHQPRAVAVPRSRSPPIRARPRPSRASSARCTRRATSRRWPSSTPQPPRDRDRRQQAKLALHLMLARIARDELGDRERARTELKAVLAQ